MHIFSKNLIKTIINYNKNSNIFLELLQKTVTEQQFSFKNHTSIFIFINNENLQHFV